MKRVWLIKTGEPLHTDGESVRLYRMGILATMLSNSGYDVTWWSSTVDHVTKKHRYKELTDISINSHLNIIHLHSMLYKRNVGISRIISQKQMAAGFRKKSRQLPRPDLILCSYPTLEFCHEAVQFGLEFNIPVILDIRDLWPDIFLDLFPSGTKAVGKLLLKPMFSLAHEVCKKATAIIGITPDFVDWGIHYAGREKTNWDQSFPLGYQSIDPDHGKISEAMLKWKSLGIGENGTDFIVSFFGNFGRQFDLETVLATARLIEKDNRNIKFVLCGNGDKFEYYKSLAANLSNVYFPGWVNAVDIWTLMKISSVGLAPYKSNEDFKRSLPNKAIEYMSSGLPLVTSLDGGLRKIVTEHNCGLYYKNGDSEQLKDHLFHLYDNPEQCRDKANNSIELYRRSYSADKVYGDLIHHMNEICSAFPSSQKKSI